MRKRLKYAERNFRLTYVLVGKIADVPVAPERFQRDGSIQVCEDQLEGVLGLVIGRLGSNQLVARRHGHRNQARSGRISPHFGPPFLGGPSFCGLDILATDATGWRKPKRA